MTEQGKYEIKEIKVYGDRFINSEWNGIKIIDVYITESGTLGAQIKCSCGRIFKTTLQAAIKMKKCKHTGRRMWIY